MFGWYLICISKVSAVCVCNERSGRRGIALIAFINILLVLFMIVGRIVLVFGLYYMSICGVSALFACNKKSGRRGAALIDFANILHGLYRIVLVLG